jgi:hypothetical protein
LASSAGGREDLGLVHVVDLERLEHLGLDEVADARLGHDRDGHRLLDAVDHLGIGHARHAPVSADVGGHALERHHRRCAGVLGHLGLIGGDDVHDHSALQHLGQPGLDAESRLVSHALESIHAAPAIGGDRPETGRSYLRRNALMRSSY